MGLTVLWGRLEIRTKITTFLKHISIHKTSHSSCQNRKNRENGEDHSVNPSRSFLRIPAEESQSQRDKFSILFKLNKNSKMMKCSKRSRSLTKGYYCGFGGLVYSIANKKFDKIYFIRDGVD